MKYYVQSFKCTCLYLKDCQNDCLISIFYFNAALSFRLGYLAQLAGTGKTHLFAFSESCQYGQKLVFNTVA